VQGTDGSFYGTTYQGGTKLYKCGGVYGCGTVFKITPNGALTTLHSFNGMDGESPYAGLVQGSDANFYGTTSTGGANGNGGTIFEITPGGMLTTLYNFCSLIVNGVCTDGGDPRGSLVLGTDGNFYGTTAGGGAHSAGTVFAITPSGMFTTLHSFDFSDGDIPYAGLVQGSDGGFYGTTYQGGATGANDGTIFTITPGGVLTTVYAFDGTDGRLPEAALVQGSDGNFYGTTLSGGTSSRSPGTVFEITPSGALTSLESFDEADGEEPYAGLVQSTNGTFYGTAYYGGTGDGTIFSLSVGLGPFVEPQPASGAVGAAVEILGTNLTGATSVTFNGTAATFTVKSKALITATVPTGATTGTVQVVTPARTLSSNVPFTVN
jgi:uncharacterized repeat protein (TIGR03803 family)